FSELWKNCVHIDANQGGILMAPYGRYSNWHLIPFNFVNSPCVTGTTTGYPRFGNFSLTGYETA
ncbi:MAG: hypothetical protein ABI813_03660, partial [Bacteroidota bacterium]